MDLKVLESELQELNGAERVKVKANKHQTAVMAINFTDDRVDVSINTSRIRSEAKWDQVRDACIREVTKY